MKIVYLFIITLFVSSCKISETIHINQDGSGTIEVFQNRDENSYMQFAGEDYNRENFFVDTTYVFNDVILKNAETFSRLKQADKDIFNKYKNVTIKSNKNSVEKIVQTKFSQHFDKLENIPDLYKTQEYLDDIRNNYALSAEEHYYKVGYSFDGTIFKRIVKITDLKQLQKEFARIDTLKNKYKILKLVENYTLNYHFPRKIKSVSNSKAIINKDEKSFLLEFQITDCLQNPEITNLEVVLE